jgi:hypothetical protein
MWAWHIKAALSSVGQRQPLRHTGRWSFIASSLIAAGDLQDDIILGDGLMLEPSNILIE